MQRFEDWPQRLAAFEVERGQMPFIWGTNDCALFACDAVLAITGTDMAANFRGRYDSARTAAKLIHDFAGAGLAELAAKVAQQFGLQELPPLMARRGDAVLIKQDNGPTLGVVASDGWHILAPQSKSRFGLRDAVRAWRIS